MNKKIHVLGGDKRAYFAAEKLVRNGFDVTLCGFDKWLSCKRGISKTNISSMGKADILLLPVKYSNDGVNIYAPYSSQPLKIREIKNISEKIYLGCCDEHILSIAEAAQIIDYMQDEAFARINAALTAQAAYSVIFGKTNVAPCESGVLIIGAGRIGTALYKILHSCDCNVFLTSRKTDKNRDYLNTSEITDYISDFDIVVNTVPHLVLGQEEISKMKEGSFIVDLSSHPHGVDFAACSKYKIRSYIELGLPGRFFPCSAGNAIADVILGELKVELN